MKKLLPYLALMLLMLTLAVSCQKDEIAPAKNEDQVALRTLNLNEDQLQDVHDALIVAIENLFNDGTLSAQQRNYLTNLLKKLQKAIDNEDLEEANLLLEDDLLDFLEALLDDGVLDQGQFDELEAIATNQPITVTGTVTAQDGVVYNWQEMADGKKWLVQNLRYVDPDASWESYYSNSAPYPELLSGRYYRSMAIPLIEPLTFADPCLAAFGPGWRLPSMTEWMGLITAYEGSWDWVDVGMQMWVNYDTYNKLVADEGNEEVRWNESQEGVGFNATVTGFYDCQEANVFDQDLRGYYLSSDLEFNTEENRTYQWIISFINGEESHAIVLLRHTPYNFLHPCRCIHD